MQTTGHSLFQRLARQLRIAARFLIPRPVRFGRSRPAEPRTVARPSREPRALARSAREQAVTRGLLPVVAAWLVMAQAGFAATIYVDSRMGSDAHDGLTLEVVSSQSGPVRTLRRAATLVRTGDRVVLVNNGTPYMGGMALAGLQQSGIPGYPLEIIGNGSVLTGTKTIAPDSWRMVADNVWRITPKRKGWYQLVLEGAAVTEVTVPPGATERPELAESSWCAFQGAIYYRPPAGIDPQFLPLELADEQTGLTLYGAGHIVIRDLTIEHFRQDGIHLHDRCPNVVLENVVCRENGRAGIVVRGTSTAQLRNVTSTGNREASLLVEELGLVDAEGSTFEPRPVVRQ